MSSPFFSSAQEAAERLGIPLLASASAATAVPRSLRRLSSLAPEAVLGARLYNKLNFPPDASVEKIWVTSPEETQERLAWAVALAEQAARAGRTAFLLDLDRPSNLSGAIGGGGRPVPESVLRVIAPLVDGEVAAWTSDLQGVRVLLPVDQAPTEEPIDPPMRWSLIVVRAVPAEVDRAVWIAGQVDATLLAVSIRDHDRAFLEAMVRTLRGPEPDSIGRIGLIGLGPVVETSPSSPLDRWQKQPERPAPRPVSSEPPSSEKPVEIEAGSGEAGIAAPVESQPSGFQPEPPAASEPSEDPVPPEAAAPTEAGGSDPGEERQPSPASRRGWKNALWILLFAAAIALAVYVYTQTTILSVLMNGPEETSRESQAGFEDSPSGVRVEIPPAAETAQNRVVEEAGKPGGSALPGEGARDPDGPTGAPRSLVGPPDPEMGSPLLPNDSLSAAQVPAWSDTFVVHVSSFRRHQDALQEVASLRNLGLTARIVPVILADRGRWERVVVGAHPGSLSAVSEAIRMRDLGLVPFAQILGHGGVGDARRITAR